MLHKPDGVVSSTDAPRDETVLSLLPKELRRIGLFPVGRLDKDTEGLLLLTNDGQLAHRLLAPGKHVDKVYYTEVDGALAPSDCEAFRQGITLGDGTECLPAELELLEEPNQALVTLREGKYHQVKRMLASRGKPVTYLKRLSMGPLELDETLLPGEYRRLTGEEVESLLAL
jgi:16S rRNA pseudouridine516 synthase